MFRLSFIIALLLTVCMTAAAFAIPLPVCDPPDAVPPLDAEQLMNRCDYIVQWAWAVKDRAYFLLAINQGDRPTLLAIVAQMEDVIDLCDEYYDALRVGLIYIDFDALYLEQEGWAWEVKDSDAGCAYQAGEGSGPYQGLFVVWWGWWVPVPVTGEWFPGAPGGP